MKKLLAMIIVCSLLVNTSADWTDLFTKNKKNWKKKLTDMADNVASHCTTKKVLYGAAGAVAVVGGAAAALPALGFSAAGVVAGSVAAGAQSAIAATGGVVGGAGAGVFAALQSAGAAGLGMGAKAFLSAMGLFFGQKLAGDCDVKSGKCEKDE